jgi:hypothetical protein
MLSRHRRGDLDNCRSLCLTGVRLFGPVGKLWLECAPFFEEGESWGGT